MWCFLAWSSFTYVPFKCRCSLSEHNCFIENSFLSCLLLRWKYSNGYHATVNEAIEAAVRLYPSVFQYPLVLLPGAMPGTVGSSIGTTVCSANQNSGLFCSPVFMWCFSCHYLKLIQNSNLFIPRISHSTKDYLQMLDVPSICRRQLNNKGFCSFHLESLSLEYTCSDKCWLQKHIWSIIHMQILAISPCQGMFLR